MDTPPKILPSSPHEWRKDARKCRLAGGTIFDLDKYKSASKIEYKQFLHLRALWKVAPLDKFVKDMTTWISDEHYQNARKILKDSESWKQYVESFNKPRDQLNKGMFPDIGAFFAARLLQLEAEECDIDEEPSPKFSPVAHRTRSHLQQTPETPETPTPKARSGEPNPPKTPPQNFLTPFDDDEQSPPTPESAKSDAPEFISPTTHETAEQFPPTTDEQIVNAALVMFLNSVTALCFETARWTLKRKVFRIGKSDREGRNGFEARVDGFLRHRSNGDVMAILEAKACIRVNKKSYIQMQEAAQMAAWISSLPENSESAQDSLIEEVSHQESAKSDIQAADERALPIRKKKGKKGKKGKGKKTPEPSTPGPERAEAHSNKRFTRLLISQDRHQIFLTFATFDQAYVNYVTGEESVEVVPSEDSNEGPFLRMNQYGPFNTSMGSHMKYLGYYILAFILQHCN